jgi:hypothetical protein
MKRWHMGGHISLFAFRILMKFDMTVETSLTSNCKGLLLFSGGNDTNAVTSENCASNNNNDNKHRNDEEVTTVTNSE